MHTCLNHNTYMRKWCFPFNKNLAILTGSMQIYALHHHKLHFITANIRLEKYSLKNPTRIKNILIVLAIIKKQLHRAHCMISCALHMFHSSALCVVYNYPSFLGHKVISIIPLRFLVVCLIRKCFDLFLLLKHMCQTPGPRATSGPLYNKTWPAQLFHTLNYFRPARSLYSITYFFQAKNKIISNRTIQQHSSCPTIRQNKQIYSIACNLGCNRRIIKNSPAKTALNQQPQFNFGKSNSTAPFNMAKLSNAISNFNFQMHGFIYIF